MTMDEYVAFLKAACERAGGNLEPRERYQARTGIVKNEDGAMIYRLQGPIDDIFGFDARSVIADIDKEDPKSLRLLIESPGGFLSDSLALYTDLTARVNRGMKLITEARGVVASAATLLYVAADERLITEGSQLMVHAPWAGIFAVGNRADLEKRFKAVLNGLESGEATYANILKSRVFNKADVDGWLKSDTWFTDTEAIDAGLSTGRIDSTDPKAMEIEASAKRVLQGIAGRYANVA